MSSETTPNQDRITAYSLQLFNRGTEPIHLTSREDYELRDRLKPWVEAFRAKKAELPKPDLHTPSED